MREKSQQERLLEAWVSLSGILKNSRLTKGLMYNEAVIMLLLYNQYCEDGIGLVSLKEIIEKTKMLKSLVNRTVNVLEKKGLLVRCQAEGDSRIGYVRCIEHRLGIFLEVHKESLSLAQNIINIIGYEDTEKFIDIVRKIENSNYKLR